MCSDMYSAVEVFLHSQSGWCFEICCGNAVSVGFPKKESSSGVGL